MNDGLFFLSIIIGILGLLTGPWIPEAGDALLILAGIIFLTSLVTPSERRKEIVSARASGSSVGENNLNKIIYYVGLVVIAIGAISSFIGVEDINAPHNGIEYYYNLDSYYTLLKVGLILLFLGLVVSLIGYFLCRKDGKKVE